MRGLFDAALDRPEAERRAFLDQACAGDAELLEGLLRLLDANRQSAAAFSSPASPQRIGRYVITEKLGTGAMGVVYRAMDPLIGRTVALKVIHLDAGATAAEAHRLRESLFREARAAGALRHPNIVTVYDLGIAEEAPFIAMECVDGPSLYQAMESSGSLGRPLAVELLKQIAAALDYAHQNGVIHRDIKPANIMLQGGTVVKIADFGIAKIQSAQTRTATGVVMGTPSYMSPEQILAKPLDGRSDQFAVGAMAFEMITGVLPFTADSMPAVLHLIVSGKRPSASRMNPLVPQRADAVFHRVLAASAKDRFSDCSEFVDSLEHALAAKTTRVARLPPVRPGIPAPPPQAHRPRMGYAAAGIGVLALALGFAIFEALRPVARDSEHGAVQPSAGSVAPTVAAPPVSIRPDAAERQKPAIVDFHALPASVKPGESFQLAWTVDGTTRTSIDSGVGDVPPHSARTLAIGATTTYTLRATNAAGASQAEVTVTVRKPAVPAPPASVGAAQVYAEAAAAWRAGLRDKALTLFATAAGAGDRRAMLKLAEIYQHGEGVSQSDREAARWLRKAADSGDASAMDTLGQMFAEGRGVPHDDAQAAAWFGNAAADHNAAGMFDLGRMYEDGRGVAKDLNAAIEWYRKAAVAGDARAKTRFAKLEAIQKPRGNQRK
jgi:hypothetical protein